MLVNPVLAGLILPLLTAHTKHDAGMTSKSPELEQTSASTDFVSIFGDGGGKDAEVAARGEESGNREGSGSEVAAGAERLPETTVTAEGMREMAVDR